MSARLYLAVFVACFIVSIPLAQASAQSVVNTAEARWDAGADEQLARSNTVTVDIDRRASNLEFFVRSSEGQTLSLRQPDCAPLGDASGAPDPSVTSVNVASASAITAGRDLVIVTNVPAVNIDPNAIDSIQVEVTSQAQDRENLTLHEAAPNSGQFAGLIATRTARFANKAGDCAISVSPSGSIQVAIASSGSANGTPLLQKSIDVIAPSPSILFDSQDGAPISGATVTLIDAATNEPARVFAEGGVASWPSTVITGETITDGAGATYSMEAGEYWFPQVDPSRYRLTVEAPLSYSAPSRASLHELALLQRADGRAFSVSQASFGQAFDAAEETLGQIDIPLDRPIASLSLSKTSSRALAQTGDAVVFTVQVTNPDPSATRRAVVLEELPVAALRLRLGSVRVDEQTPTSSAVTAQADGTGFAIELGDVLPGETRKITYAMTVRSDAAPGNIESLSEARSSLGANGRANAALRIERDLLADRMTILGRVSAGPCSISSSRPGIAGIRIMMEDGSFAITDAEGRYHFDGVTPGSHVVQLARSTLPEGAQISDCADSAQSAGSAASRFVSGQGGSLVKIDFHVQLPAEFEPAAPKETQAEAPIDPVQQWLALGDGPDDWITPTVDENPRAPAIHVAIRHRIGSKVSLQSGQDSVDPILFQGTIRSKQGDWAISHWQGVPLPAPRTELKAIITDKDGMQVKTLDRTVYFTSIAASAEIVANQSTLVADGRTRPIVAVRILDPAGRPLREGVSGILSLSSPYQSAAQMEQRQLDATSRRGPAEARWRVEGSNGIAFIELAPTMVSGSLTMDFEFTNSEFSRRQQLEAWIVPGDVEWTIIGLAEGSFGARSIADNMERTGSLDSDLGQNARVAFYAKGRILGRFLTTIAYDSAKQTDDQRIFGALDPNAYYTVFADGSGRLFDAVSRNKLYLRIETSNFLATYGDFRTGFDQAQLTRYNRALTGVQAEARLGKVKLDAFAANVRSRISRDELQGDGTSGPYTLSSNAVVPNSETIYLEVRDRLRSELVLERRQLTAFVDYELDRLSGTIIFNRPVLSQTNDLNPQFIVAEYESENSGQKRTNAGVRAAWTNADSSVRIGATILSDKGDDARTNIIGVDARAQLSPEMQIRAEYALSRAGQEKASGWSIEGDYQSETVDGRIYAQSLDSDYGIGQQNGVELGARKIGADVRIAVDQSIFFTMSAWESSSLEDDRRRRAAEGRVEFVVGNSSVSLGVANFGDRGVDGTKTSSTILRAAATQRLLDSRLEVSASTSLALDQAQSADLPAQHRLGARYRLNDAIRISGSYEIADGAAIQSKTLTGGVELTAWPGGQLSAKLGQQSQSSSATGGFAGLGLAQSLQLNDNLQINATIDANRALTSSDPADLVIVPGQPFASGGQLGHGGSLLEDFTAYTLGATWRHDLWAVNARGEYRDARQSARKGVFFGAMRQVGNGSMIGSSVNWTNASGIGDSETEIFDAALAIAHRPQNDALALLAKLQYRSDYVQAAVQGGAGPLGRTRLTVDGDALSRRLIASLSADVSNLLPLGVNRDRLRQRSALRFFTAMRHNFDQIEGLDLSTTTVLGGLSASIALTNSLDIGGQSTLRGSLNGGDFSYALGPFVRLSPATDTLITLGYNIAGFSDPDFAVRRNTETGIYISVIGKFDAERFDWLQ